MIYRENKDPLLRRGDLHRLSDAPRSQVGVETHPKFQLSHDDRHLLLGFSLGPFGATYGLEGDPDLVIVPRALVPDRRYRLRELVADGAGEAIVRSGAEWMAQGLRSPSAWSFAGMLV